MTLRARLLLALVLMVSVAVVVTNVTAVTALRSYLLDQVDSQLAELPPPVMRLVEPNSQSSRPAPENGGGPGGGGRFGSNDVYVQVRSTEGVVQAEYAPLLKRESEPAPSISAEEIADHTDGRPFTVGAQGDESYKYRAVITSLTDGRTVSVATPLKVVDETVMRLVAIDVVVSLIVLAALLIIGWFVIRTDLRPLEHMADTAGAIAAGDLSQRIDRADDKTEVGRLGTALNTMLGQIEMSFAQRQASEDRLRRFAADASHELRTPITSIRGYAELYRAGALADPGELQRAMGRIENESSRMGTLVDDLLLLARLDQGRPLEQTDVDLTSLTSDVVGDASVTSPDRQISLDAPGSVSVKGDRQRLQQIITNLLSNAVRHTPDGTPIHISLAADDGRAVLKIRDEGPGLDAEAASRVFERFYRVDTGRARSAGGTGLGLAIVQSLVIAHGGAVSVESTPGEGATFIVELPLA